MPTIIDPENMQENSAQGWSVRTVADAAQIGFPAMVANWWTFDPGVTGPQRTRGKADELLYVIRGTGQAVVGEQIFDLDQESVLWLEEGETYHLIAGDQGLEILQGYAPGDANNA